MRPREPRWTLSPRARAAAAGLALLLGASLLDTPAWAQQKAPVLYQWTDERGNVRYTPDPDRVPSSQRGTMQRIEPGAPTPSSALPRPALETNRTPAASAVLPPAPPAPTAPSAAPAPAPTPEPVATEAPAPRPEPAAVPAPAPSVTTPEPLEPLEPMASSSPAPGPVATPEAVATPEPIATPEPMATPQTPATPEPAAAPGPVAAPTPAPVAAPPAPAATAEPAAGDAAREQQLVAAIAADQEILKTLISTPVAPGASPVTDSEQLREIARRLPEMQAELAALRERRASPAGP